MPPDSLPSRVRQHLPVPTGLRTVGRGQSHAHDVSPNVGYIPDGHVSAHHSTSFTTGARPVGSARRVCREVESLSPRRLRGDLNSFVKEFRSKVRSIGPTQRVEFRMNRNLHEAFGILQGGKYFPVKFIAKINITLRPVIKPDIDNEIMFISGFKYFRYHRFTESGYLRHASTIGTAYSYFKRVIGIGRVLAVPLPLDSHALIARLAVQSPAATASTDGTPDRRPGTKLPPHGHPRGEL